MHTRPVDRVPRRMLSLIIFGALFVGYGMRIFFSPHTATLDSAILHEILPVWVEVIAWELSGFACIILASSRKTEKMGWRIAMVMPIWRVISYLVSAAMWIIPGWPPGAVSSFGAAFFWGGIAGLVLLLAGWPEHDSRDAVK